MNDLYLLAVNTVSKKLFPRNAAKIQKRFLRRYLRKPETMSTRHYATRVSEINDLFAYFPIKANNAAPGRLPIDNLFDILEFGCPPKWQKQMILQDFDVTTSTVSQFVDFCDQIKRAKYFDTNDLKSCRREKNDKRRAKNPVESLLRGPVETTSTASTTACVITLPKIVSSTTQTTRKILPTDIRNPVTTKRSHFLVTGISRL